MQRQEVEDRAVTGRLRPQALGVVAEEGSRGRVLHRVRIAADLQVRLWTAVEQAQRIGRIDPRAGGAAVLEVIEAGAGGEHLEHPVAVQRADRIDVLDQHVGVGGRIHLVRHQPRSEVAAHGENRVEAGTRRRRQELRELVVRVVPGGCPVRLVVDLQLRIDQGIERCLPEHLATLLTGDDDAVGIERPVAGVGNLVRGPEHALAVLQVPGDLHGLVGVPGPRRADAVDRDDLPEAVVAVVGGAVAGAVVEGEAIDDVAGAPDLVVQERRRDLLADLAGRVLGLLGGGGRDHLEPHLPVLQVVLAIGDDAPASRGRLEQLAPRLLVQRIVLEDVVDDRVAGTDEGQVDAVEDQLVGTVERLDLHRRSRYVHLVAAGRIAARAGVTRPEHLPDADDPAGARRVRGRLPAHLDDVLGSRRPIHAATGRGRLLQREQASVPVAVEGGAVPEEVGVDAAGRDAVDGELGHRRHGAVEGTGRGRDLVRHRKGLEVEPVARDQRLVGAGAHQRRKGVASADRGHLLIRTIVVEDCRAFEAADDVHVAGAVGRHRQRLLAPGAAAADRPLPWRAVIRRDAGHERIRASRPTASRAVSRRSRYRQPQRRSTQ